MKLKNTKNTKSKKLKLRNFQDLIEEILTKEEIAEIEKKVKIELAELKRLVVPKKDKTP